MNKYISNFSLNEHTFYYCNLAKVFEDFPKLKKLPRVLKLFLEANIRVAKEEDLNKLIQTFLDRNSFKKIKLEPTRVILENEEVSSTLVDFAIFRDFVNSLDRDINKVKPQVLLDAFVNINKESQEKLKFIKWSTNSFENLSVIPMPSNSYPLLNLDYLSTLIFSKVVEEKVFIYPESLVGNGLQVNLANALGILALKRSELSLESILLGAEVKIEFPSILAIEIKGSFVQGISIEDILYALKKLFEENSLKDKYIEFTGEGIKNLSLVNKAQISNELISLGANCAYFPMDEKTVSYLEQTRGVDVSFIDEYYKKQKLFLDDSEIKYDEIIEFNLSLVKAHTFSSKNLEEEIFIKELPSRLQSFKKGNFVNDNDVVLSIIRVCPSSFNLFSFVQSALLAKKAIELGLEANSNIKKYLILENSFIKTCLEKLDLVKYFEALGFIVEDRFNKEEFSLVERVSLDIEKFNLNVSSVVSNLDFFEEFNSLIKSNWIFSPSLVLAYTFKGDINFDPLSQALHTDIYLSDIWPSVVEVDEVLEKLDSSFFANYYQKAFEGNETWQELEVLESKTYSWNENSIEIKPVNFLTNESKEEIKIEEAKIVALFENDILASSLISLGQVAPYSVAAKYLQEKGISLDKFDTYKNRYTNYEVMQRAAFSSVELRNKIVSPKEGGYTKDFSTFEIMTIFEFCMKNKEQNRDLVLVLGDIKGESNSKFTALSLKFLGIKAILAKSFDEVFRKDLIRCGILPLEFFEGDDINSLKLKGDELLSFIKEEIKIDEKINMSIRKDFTQRNIEVKLRLDSKEEVNYYKSGSSFEYLLKGL